ncbi:hypothetical protein BDY21DRAFT_360361 [Lineolata rhizophorae]|uniref:Uncharacterized protein n=1 Tax=Lineolata rhizophorae TaxID=578093 RepID=A0A6A6PEJ9_9PEZI|nr:hypothetical protein BDY21DRAFT_360361 [Lineolata rhizophorae]
MDGHMDIKMHYEVSPDGSLSGIKPVEHFSKDKLKICPTCRGSIRNISRYGRVVRRAFLDESMKKFIAFEDEQRLLADTLGEAHKVPALLKGELNIDFTENREQCLELLEEAQQSQSPLQAVEAHVYFANYVVIEGSRLASEDREPLHQVGIHHVEAAKAICRRNAGPTKGMVHEVETVEKILRASTFYSVVTSDEWKAVLAAMTAEFRGTRHCGGMRDAHAGGVLSRVRCTGGRKEPPTSGWRPPC